jgi:hypothetical protein
MRKILIRNSGEREELMIILSKIDYDGTDLKADLEKLDRVHRRIQRKLRSGKIEGPYFPQDASLLYIFHVEKYEWLNQAGRIWFEEAAKEGLAFTPKSYEVAVTPKEFFG